MITCPHCGYENPDNRVLCIQCSLPLDLNSVGQNGGETEGTTRLLDQAPRSVSTPRWGTASLGAGRRVLLHVRGYDTPLVVQVAEEMVIGRFDTGTGETPQIDLGEFDGQDLGVSRRHALILLDEDGLKVMDLNSANFTFINGQKLIPHQARILRDGDELRLGRMVIRVAFA